MSTRLSSSFFQQSAPEVARSLLGMRLVRRFSDGLVAGRIVETEAYSGPDDRASHASRKNPGNARLMFGPPGIIYVYKVYGLHVCLNVVTGPETTAGAVLLRALEPLEGLDIMRRHRGDHISDRDLARGPGNLTRAFGIDLSFNGASIDNNELWIQPEQNDRPIESGPRVGVAYAGECADWPWRFRIKGSPFASRARS
ncbi:MAG: DNA-3-methyladenine glycosylase [candidate division KSB1 bacterium]|nr:DNA-3-methyladenine glycosylase [candidate division KSB1 bacterium]